MSELLSELPLLMMRHWHHALSGLDALCWGAFIALTVRVGRGIGTLSDKFFLPLCLYISPQALQFLLEILKKWKKICHFGQRRTLQGRNGFRNRKKIGGQQILAERLFQIVRISHPPYHIYFVSTGHQGIFAKSSGKSDFIWGKYGYKMACRYFGRFATWASVIVSCGSVRNTTKVVL